MSAFRKYYGLSMVLTIVAIAAAFAIWGAAAALTVGVLGLMEISLSMDNAVVNAKILENWDEKWRNRFVTWGMFIAVFGVRFILPLVIVSVATGIGPVAVTSMALHSPDIYAAKLQSVHHVVSGFGGAFLFMIAFAYFFEEKQVYWWEMLESRLTKIGQLEGIAAAIVLAGMAILSNFYTNHEQGSQFFIAGVWGVVTFIIVKALGSVLGGEDENDAGSSVVKAGILGFLYLELVDASFSGDGVTAAFVLSTYLPIIAIGLGIGALFVRSMTLHLVAGGTLSEYRYLEHGAFYAILALAVIMFASGLGYELPEWVNGSLSAAILVVAFLHSVSANRRDVGTPAVA